MPRLRSSKTAAATSAPSAADPFADDPFWDSWDNPDSGDSNSEEDDCAFQEDFSDPKFDLGSSVLIRKGRDAEANGQREQRLQKMLDDLAATKERMKKKAEAEAAKLAALEQQQKEDAEQAAEAAAAVRFEVKRAFNCISLAKPLEALRILGELLNSSEFERVDTQEQFSIATMYDALDKHYELQKMLSIV